MTLALTLSGIAEAADGTILRGIPGTPVKGISTDTRTLGKGDWFLALIGPNFDGHAYVGEAVAKGAAGLILSNEAAHEAGAKRPALLVKDTLAAYGDIARAWRRRVGAKVACIAGSGGKTTTKDLAAHVMGGRRDVVVSHGNFNNLVGLPATLLRMSETDRMALTELGMNTPGELGRLTSIAEPDIAALTNIGDAHVGMFGSVEALAEAKAELMRAMKPGARLLINADNPWSMEMARRHAGHLKVMRFAIEADAEYRAEQIKPLEPWGYAFDLAGRYGSAHLELPLFGRHNVANALCAAALLCEIGIDAGEIAQNMRSFRPTAMRSQIEKIGDILLIEDCYNASPSSTISALSSLGDISAPGRRHVTLGDMLELGESEQELHKRVGQAAATVRNVVIRGVGERARWIVDAAAEAGVRAEWMATTEEAGNAIAADLAPGDIVLLKASRLMRFERLAGALRAHLGAASPASGPGDH